ncbi:YihY/virulence factor BrkB family protein [Cumulibacter manganitolerans]|uniref:YihY/virulence factor BrkB family protein n=1 Tax=Cumulibacter manganitolerans TaxID=1884992 RepID=UPI00129657A3|nr:YihY/virulence factor BrkB family protein [Cumulibacter manganitolerans]
MSDRVPLRQLARQVDDLQSVREEPAPDPEAGRVVRRFRAMRAKWEWFDHAVIALLRYDRRNGDTYAAGLTFQTFTAIVPLLMLAAAGFGLVLRREITWARDLFEKVAEQIPGGGGEVLIRALRAVQTLAGTIGVLSLLLVLWLGTSWIGNMRVAIQRMWGHIPGGVSWLKEKGVDLVVLIGLGLAALVSLGLSTSAGDITGHIVSALGLDHIPGAGVFLKIVAVGAALLADIAILQYMMVTLARQRVSRRPVLRGAVLGAVGFEILKLLGTVFIGRLISTSPAAGVFGAIVVLLVWLNLICRWLLIVVCWTATSRPVLDAQLTAFRRESPGQPT